MALRPPPSPAAAMAMSMSICHVLATEADRNEEISHPEEELMDQFPPGSFVKTIFESGGDAEVGIPAFARGNKFCVIAQHDGGWLSVPEGYLMVSWVVPCDAPPESTSVRDRCLSMRKRLVRADDDESAAAPAAEAPTAVEYALQRGSDKLGLQITGGTEECPAIYVFKVHEGGVAARDGRLRKGDQLLAVNGTSVDGFTHGRVVETLKESGTVVKLLVLPRRRKGSSKISLPGGEMMFGFNNELQLPPGAPPIADDSESSSDDEDALPASMLTSELQAMHIRAALPLAFKVNSSKQGWLTKQGGGHHNPTGAQASMFSRKNWKRRYFVLQDTMLKYYKAVPKGGDTATGYINLDGGAEIHKVDSSKAFAIETQKRTCHLLAETDEEAQLWIEVLQNVILRSRAESLIV